MRNGLVAPRLIGHTGGAEGCFSMPRILPEKFGWRERLLALLAVALAIASGCLTWAAGLGAGGAWMIFTLAGTCVMVVVAGEDRCFFTGLFTGLLAGGLLLGMALSLMVDQREGLREEHAVMGVSAIGASVIVPSAFAWLVTFLVRRLRSTT